MSKTSRRQVVSHGPNPAQLAAVRRTAKAGQTPQARQRLATLRAAFPGFKPLLGLAWEIEDLDGDPMRVAARAYEWHQASPGSRAALEALHESAERAGLTALQIRAYRALQALGGTDRPPPLQLFMPTDESLSLTQAEALELGRMHMHDRNPQAAGAALRGVDHPSARNNLAVALFAMGDVAAALHIAEASWHSEPNNLFALERVLRWRCWAEGVGHSTDVAATLRQARPDRAEHANAQVAALRFLGQAEAAHQAWKDAAQAPYWKPDVAERATFDALADPTAELPGGPTEWFPSAWLDKMHALARQSRQSHPDSRLHTEFDAGLDLCDAHADYLDRATELGDEIARQTARAVLKRCTLHGDVAAIEALEQGLKHPVGTDTERHEVLTWLVGHNLKKPGEPIEIWREGSLRRSNPTRIEIHNEPPLRMFPPEWNVVALQTTQEIDRRNWQEALEHAQRWQRMYPQHASPLVHLAAIKAALHHPDTEVIHLYRQAYDLSPDDLFARCALAMHLAEHGQPEEARTLLDGWVNQPQQMHHTEYRTFMHAQRALAAADNKQKAVQAIDAALAKLNRQFPG